MTASVLPLRLTPMHKRPSPGRRLSVWMRDGSRRECHSTMVHVGDKSGIDAAIGRKLARAKAIDKIGPLLGFRLRDRLAATPTDFRERVRLEAKELEGRLLKLQVFLNSPAFEALSFEERNRLSSQEAHMSGYLNVLYSRIADFEA